MVGDGGEEAAREVRVSVSSGHLVTRIVCALVVCASLAHGAPPTTRTVRVVAPNLAAAPKTRGIPGVAAQSQAEQRIRQIYSSDYQDTSFNGRRALAKRLIDASEQTQSDWDAKYVLLREARSLAAVVGDVTTAFEAIDLMVESFPVTKLHLRIEALQSAMPTLSAANANLAAASMCMDLVDQSIVEGEYERAEMLLALATEAARKAKSKPYFEWIEARAAVLRPLKDAWEVARPAQVALARAPDDPAANLVAGTFVTFVKGDFDTGLPMLAKSADGRLSALAKQDLQTPADRPSLQLKTAGAWWDLAEGQPVDYQPAIRKRAGLWYRKAVGSLDGLDRALAQRRLQELTPPKKRGERSRRPPDALMLQPNRWYRANIAEVSWETAMELSQALGGQLASIETRVEGDLITKLVKGRTLWLGGTFDVEKRWTWLTGGDFLYANWASGEPNKPVQDAHPVTSENGAWKVGGKKAGFVVEWSE